jgi:hypothetical protein
VSIPRGAISTQLSLPIIHGTGLPQPDRYFYLNLVAITNALLARTQAVAIIMDQIFYTISIAGTSVENRGNNTNTAFRLTLSPSCAAPVSVQYETLSGTATAGSDYAPRAGSLVFSPGSTNLSLNIPIFGNSSVNTNKTFSVLLSQPENAILGVDEAIGTIVDDALVGPLTIQSIQLQGGKITIQFQSIAGRVYQVERATNLSSGVWTPVASGVAGTGGVFVVSDGSLVQAAARFYRLVLLP